MVLFIACILCEYLDGSCRDSGVHISFPLGVMVLAHLPPSLD
jgi:hypothetical protein